MKHDHTRVPASHVRAICWSIAVLVTLFLFTASLVLGNLNQDEGWYLLAAKRVSNGAWPFRDFAFTQGPVFPLFYGAFYGLVNRQGVLGGRLLTAGLGLAACGLAALLAARCVPHGKRNSAALLGLIFTGVNLYQAYFTTIVKTYALCSCLLLAGLLLLARADQQARRTPMAMLAGLLMAWAAATRLSAGAAIPVTAIYLMFRTRLKQPPLWGGYIAGAALGGAVALLPFFLAAPRAVLFGLFQFHTLRTPPGWADALFFKAGFVARVTQGYTWMLVTLVAMLLLRLLFRLPEDRTASPGQAVFGTGLLWWVVGSVSVLHLLAPFPYDDYQAFIMPVLAAGLAAGIASLLPTGVPHEQGLSSAVSLVVLAGALVTTVASPLWQEWTILRRDRIWWITKQQPDLLALRYWGAWLRNQPDAGDVLLTQDAYLAIEAGLDVPRGLEMGPFSYYPDLTNEEAAAIGGVLNREKLLHLINQADAPYAAFSGYGLSIHNPSVTKLPETERDLLLEHLRKRYALAVEVPDFGQGHTLLRIYRRHPTASGSAPGR